MESRKAAQPAESAEHDLASGRAHASSRDHSREVDGWLAGPVIGIVAVAPVRSCSAFLLQAGAAPGWPRTDTQSVALPCWW